MAKRITPQDLSKASITPQATIRDTYIQQGVKKTQTLYDLAMLQDVAPKIAESLDLRAEAEAEQKINEALATDGIDGLKKLSRSYKGAIPGVYTPLAKARTSQALARRAIDLEKSSISEIIDKYSNAASAGVNLEVPFSQAIKDARESIRKDLHPELNLEMVKGGTLENFYYTTEYNKHSTKLQGKVEEVAFQIETLKKENQAKINLYQDIGSLVSSNVKNKREALNEIATSAFEAGVPKVATEVFAEVKSQLIRMANTGRSEEALATLIDLGEAKIGPISLSEGDNRDSYNKLFSSLASASSGSSEDSYLRNQRVYKNQSDLAFSKQYLNEEEGTKNPAFELTKTTNPKEANAIYEQLINLSPEELVAIGVSWEARNTFLDQARNLRSSISAIGADNQRARTFQIKERVSAGDFDGASSLIVSSQDRLTFEEESDKKFRIDREADNNKDAEYVVDISIKGIDDADRTLFGDKAEEFESEDRFWADIQQTLIEDITKTEDPISKNELRKELRDKVFEHKQRSNKRKEEFLERRRSNEETISERVSSGVPVSEALRGLDMTAQEKKNAIGSFSSMESARKSARSAFSRTTLEKEAKGIIDSSYESFAGETQGVGVRMGFVLIDGTITKEGIEVQQAYVDSIINTMENFMESNKELLITDPKEYSDKSNSTLNQAKIQYNPFLAKKPTAIVPGVKNKTKADGAEGATGAPGADGVEGIPITQKGKNFPLYENTRTTLSSFEEYSGEAFNGNFSDDLVSSLNYNSTSKGSIKRMSSESKWNGDLMRSFVRHSSVLGSLRYCCGIIS